MKKLLIPTLFLIMISLLLGCAQQTTTTLDIEEAPKEEIKEAPPAVEEEPTQEEEAKEKEETLKEENAAEVSPAWMDTDLTDVKTGKNFKISDFKGKPILLESFGAWCPICTQQQNKMKQLHGKLGDSLVSISLDTDPNEDTAIVKKYLDDNGFDWLFAIAPADLTKALTNQFGVRVIFAPSAPIVLICEDLSTRFLKSGVKSAEKLEEEIAKGC